MDCKTAQTWLFRKLDDELSLEENNLLDAHLEVCGSCARAMKLLFLPRRIGKAIPTLQPSPFFYSRLKARIESEPCPITIWQMILGISRQVVPVLGAITVTILLTFTYLNLRDPLPDLYQAFDSVFTASDRATRMVIADGEITNDSVLLAIAEGDASSRTDFVPASNESK